MKRILLFTAIFCAVSFFSQAQNATATPGTIADSTKPAEKKYFVFMTINQFETALKYLEMLKYNNMPLSDHEAVKGIQQLIVGQVSFQLQQEAADSTKPKPVPAPSGSGAKVPKKKK